MDVQDKAGAWDMGFSFFLWVGCELFWVAVSFDPRWACDRPSVLADRVGTEQYGDPRSAARSFLRDGV